MNRADSLVAAAAHLRDSVNKLRFRPPVTHVYNPLVYAWRAHEIYLRRYGNSPKRVLFLGMNPGPFGMAQTGVPFGQVAAARDWLGVSAKIDNPPNEHPKRPITGFNCQRSEVSGERLWGLFAKRFGTPGKFFAEHFVANYCPLVFIGESGRNRTPDKLPPNEREKLFVICDAHLREVMRILEPEWIIGVGAFAENRAANVDVDLARKIARILHPSPSCPESNIDWAGKVTRQLRKLGVWR